MGLAASVLGSCCLAGARHRRRYCQLPVSNSCVPSCGNAELSFSPDLTPCHKVFFACFHWGFRALTWRVPRSPVTPPQAARDCPPYYLTVPSTLLVCSLCSAGYTLQLCHFSLARVDESCAWAHTLAISAATNWNSKLVVERIIGLTPRGRAKSPNTAGRGRSSFSRSPSPFCLVPHRCRPPATATVLRLG